MTPTREAALLALAREKPVAQRSAFLDAACEGDSAFRAIAGTRRPFIPLDQSDSKRCLCPLPFYRDDWT